MNRYQRLAVTAISTLAATATMLPAYAAASPGVRAGAAVGTADGDVHCSDLAKPTPSDSEQICLFVMPQTEPDPPGTFLASIVPSNAIHLGIYTIDWGDGTPVKTGIPDAEGPDGLEQHTYKVSGTYTVTVHPTELLGGWPTLQPLTQTVTATVPASPPPPPPHVPNPATVHRIGGSDRYATARLVSQAQWKTGAASAVVLARGDQATDALTGVPLAARVHGPLLLTSPTALDGATRAEIDRATGGPSASKTVYILGGDSAISPGIEAGLRKAGYKVVRYAGADRYGTALAIAASFGATPHVIVATGTNFPDALAAGPLGAVEDAPIVLSGGDSLLDANTAAYVRSRSTVDPVGGAAEDAVAELPGLDPAHTVVDRTLSGATRYETATLVADKVTALTGHPATALGVASGTVFPDALIGGAYAANAGIPLLLTDPATLPTATAAALTQRQSTLTSITVFGGPVAVSDTVEGLIAGAVQGQVR